MKFPAMEMAWAAQVGGKGLTLKLVMLNPPALGQDWPVPKSSSTSPAEATATRKQIATNFIYSPNMERTLRWSGFEI